MSKAEKVARTSPDLIADQIEQLRAIFPEAFSEGSMDWDRLRATVGEIVDDRPERYSFTWAGKQDAIRALQIPSRAALVPCPEESVNWGNTQHVFIEGENSEVLKLLYKAYFGRVKMIYIDPPYNTGNDFVYPDNYTDPLDAYLQLTGQKDTEGNLLTSNPQTSGRYHSAWLSMMYPRLFVARQLLREDGLIFISIDDNEVHNLRMLMNEIFGEENFVVCIVWRRRQVPDNRNVNQVSTDHEYMVVYGRGSATFSGTPKDLLKYQNPDNDPRGPWMSDNLTGLATREQRPNLHYDLVNPETGVSYPPHPSRGWIFGRQKMDRLIAERKILWPSDPGGRPRLKHFLSEIKSRFTGFTSVQDVGYTTDGTREIVDLFGQKPLDFPKPTALMKAVCQQGTDSDEGDLVVDFFAGSCTTAQAVLELNREDGGDRRFVMVQLPEPLDAPKPLDNGVELRTIADMGKERIRRVIQKLETADGGQESLDQRGSPEDLGFRVYKLTESSFRQWTPPPGDAPEAFTSQMGVFADPLVDGWKPERVIWEVALKEGFGLNCQVERLAHVPDNAVWRVTDPDKEQSFRICLDATLDPGAIRSLDLGRDDLFICRDIALDDSLAANLALQCRLKAI